MANHIYPLKKTENFTAHRWVKRNTAKRIRGLGKVAPPVEFNVANAKPKIAAELVGRGEGRQLNVSENHFALQPSE